MVKKPGLSLLYCIPYLTRSLWSSPSSFLLGNKYRFPQGSKPSWCPHSRDWEHMALHMTGDAILFGIEREKGDRTLYFPQDSMCFIEQCFFLPMDWLRFSLARSHMFHMDNEHVRKGLSQLWPFVCPLIEWGVQKRCSQYMFSGFSLLQVVWPLPEFLPLFPRSAKSWRPHKEEPWDGLPSLQAASCWNLKSPICSLNISFLMRWD